jgi:hypothetical protein
VHAWVHVRVLELVRYTFKFYDFARHFCQSAAGGNFVFAAFGQVQCPVIPGAVRPISRKGNLENMCGKYRGIQGHHNSCYLDATLFSMFTFTR